MRRHHAPRDEEPEQGSPAAAEAAPPAGVPEAEALPAEAEPDALSATQSEADGARVDRLEAELAQERERTLRVMAEFQNFRRRTEEQTRATVQFANQEFALSLLPVIDNLERALAAAETQHSYETLMGGVAITVRQLADVLQRNGVKPIEAVGQEFDPNLHEAMMRVEDGEHPENTVVGELERGYTIHGRVLRPSRVRVAVHP